MGPLGVEQILQQPLEGLYLVVVFGMLRTFGVLFGFLAFGWGFGPALTARIGISFMLGLPLMFAHETQLQSIIASASAVEQMLLTAKEFAFGFGLGLLASGPFRALLYAGAITDAFRGESDSGMQAPDGSQIQTSSKLYLLTGFFVFFSLGGLSLLTSLIYQSYGIWPVDRMLPSLFSGSGQIVLTMITQGLRLALLIAAPLLILLFSVEFVLAIAARLARRFGLYDLSFLVKNTLTILTLPLIAIIILRVSNALGARVTDSFEMLQVLLP